MGRRKRKPINTTVVITVVGFVVSCLSLMWIANKVMGSSTSVNKYYLKSNYDSDQDLMATLLARPSKLFLWCCDCIQFYAVKMGLTYEQLNIHLFVILQPALILMFATLFVIQTVRLSRYSNQQVRNRLHT